MPNQIEEFTCTIKHMFRDCPKPDGWFGCFATIKGHATDITLKGTTTIALQNGMQLNIKAYRDQKGDYNVEDLNVNTKTTRGMVAYLASLNGVSKQTASKVVFVFGSDTLDVIANDPDRLGSEAGLTERQIKAITKGINENSDTNSLRKFLPELSINQIKRIKTIPNIKDAVKDDPYMLCNITGISFPIADTVALRLGIEEYSPYRVNHGIIHILNTITDGNLYVNLSNTDELVRLMTRVEALLRIKFPSIKEFATRLQIFSTIPDSPIKIEQYNNESHLYLSEKYKAMIVLARLFKTKATKPSPHGFTKREISGSIVSWERQNGCRLTDEQRKAITTTLSSQLSIITGGPGRGKTKVIDCIASKFRPASTRGRCNNVLLLAPTGKAVNKLRDDTNDKFESMTIDSYLLKKIHNKHIYEKTMLIIIDEASMIDLMKMAQLMNCIGDTPVCFVGDVDQLPPIADGYVFKDMIDSRTIQTSYLTIPFRNTGTITDNADKIKNNDINLKYNFTDMPFYPQADDNDAMIDFIMDTYNDERENFPNLTDVTIISPVRKGPVGTVNLNILLQEQLCPESITGTLAPRTGEFIGKGHPIKTSIYGNSSNYTHIRVGDIVINTVNKGNVPTFKMTNDDYWNGTIVQGSERMGIVNGDTGRVIAYRPSYIDNNGDEVHEYCVIQFFDNRFCKLDIVDGDFESFELAYVITVHKSQGSEYENVIYVSPKSMLNYSEGFATRNLIYTAITRAKQKVTIIGSKDSINYCIMHNLPETNTNFKERLQ